MRRQPQTGFTLVELLVAVSILTVIILAVTRLFDSASAVASNGNRRLDADAHARPLVDRMALDFAKMLKRSDLDYYLKEPSSPQAGNDQLAFFCDLSGYYPSTGSQSPLSLVAYRINSVSQMERMGKGLVWNGVSTTNASLVFLPIRLTDLWLAATNNNPDPDYEVVGNQTFRFEYCYLLSNGTLSVTPWDVAAGHTTVSGLQDVTAIRVMFATIDPKSRVLLSNTQLATLGASLPDCSDGQVPGALANQWQMILDQTLDLPRPAISSVRIYERYFHVR